MTQRPLAKSIWQQMATDHVRAVQRWTTPFRERRRLGESHPVHDFLFIYYRYSPAKLEQWHPGIGLHLETNDRGKFDQAHYSLANSCLYCDPAKISDKEFRLLRWIVDLLQQTQQRRGNYSCCGMHEWAMVYRGTEIRHEKTTKLRLPQHEIDAVVESRPITCSHFDAFRFFADDARPLNLLSPTLESRTDMEQPACIHANMDLYKWAFKSMPWIGSDMLRECFELALQARVIDMRASPYDLAPYDDFSPIKIETAAGRAQYEDLQREIATQAALVREKLIGKIEHTIEGRQTAAEQTC